MVGEADLRQFDVPRAFRHQSVGPREKVSWIPFILPSLSSQSGAFVTSDFSPGATKSERSAAYWPPPSPHSGTVFPYINDANGAVRLEANAISIARRPHPLC